MVPDLGARTFATGAEAKSRPVPLTSRIAFGIGELSEGMKRTAFSLFVLFFYNQVLGLRGALAGLALFVAVAVDSVTDPLIGSLSDHHTSRIGRRHPFMYASAVPLALVFFALFAPPSGLGEIGLFVWLLIFSVLARAAITLYYVPHLALGAEMTEDSQERTKLISLRQLFSYLGGAFVTIAGLGWFFSDARGGRLLAENYRQFALVVGALMAVAILLSASGTRSQIGRLNSPPARRGGVLEQLRRDLRESMSNRPLRWLCAGTGGVMISTGVHQALDLYMLQHYWGFASKQMVMIRLAPLVGMLTGVFIVRPVSRHLGKRFTLLVGVTLAVVFQTSPVLLRFAGLFPANGTLPLFAALVTTETLQGACAACAVVAFVTMITDVTDLHELETGARREGVLFGVVTFTIKASVAIAGFIAGVGLDVIDWPRGVDAVAETIPASIVERLGTFYGPALMTFTAAAIWCFLHYRLDDDRRAEIMRDLYVRRSGAGDRAST